MKFRIIFLVLHFSLSIIFTGCSGKTTESNPVYETEAAPLPTNTPTTEVTPTRASTPTPEVLTVEDFKVVDGKIQENKNGTWQEVSAPTEMGEIAYIEEHEGKMYGIDTVERAIVVRNETGEWVTYERPILGADFNSYYNDSKAALNTYSFEESQFLPILEDISSDKIVRLLDEQGKVMPWGYQKGSYLWRDFVDQERDPLPELDGRLPAAFSGYFLGIIDGSYISTFKNNSNTFNGKSSGCYVFEIPNKYSRQILLLFNPRINHDDAMKVTFSDSITGLPSETKDLSMDEFDQLLKLNLTLLRGSQVKIEIIVNSGEPYLEYNNFWLNSLKGDSYDIRDLFEFGTKATLNLPKTP